MELLQVDERGEADWPEWLQLRSITVKELRWKPAGIGFENDELVECFRTLHVTTATPIFRGSDGSQFSIEDFIKRYHVEQGPEALDRQFREAEDQPQAKVRTIRPDVASLGLHLMCGSEPSDLPVSSIELGVEYWIETQEVPLRRVSYVKAPDSGEVGNAFVTEPFFFDGKWRRFGFRVEASPSGYVRVPWRMQRAD